jgi:hypothetical protein
VVVVVVGWVGVVFGAVGGLVAMVVVERGLMDMMVGTTVTGVEVEIGIGVRIGVNMVLVVERPVISMPGIAMAVVVVVAVVSCLAVSVPWVAVGRAAWGMGRGMW